MSINKSLGKLCMAYSRPYVFAGCFLYPIRAVFDTDRHTYTDVRATVLRGCDCLCLVMADLLVEEGYNLDTADRDFAIIGTMTCPVETRPMLGTPAAPTATLVVCLPNSENDDQFLEKLLTKHKKRLIAACPGIVDIEINVSFGDDGCQDILLEEPFTRGAGSQDLVFASLWDLEIEHELSIPRRKVKRPKAKADPEKAMPKANAQKAKVQKAKVQEKKQG